VSALPLCGRNVDGKDLAQFPGGGISVKVVGTFIHFFPPEGPKRSVLILSAVLPQALRKPAALSTNGVGPQT
jgi:hypothetical protein